MARRPRVTRGLAALFVSVAGLGMLAGCQPSGPEAEASKKAAEHAKDCEQVAAIQPEPGAPILTVVTDQTASNRARKQPDAIATVLTEMQAETATIKVVGVGGEGEQSPLLPPLALDPKPGHDSREADAYRQVAITCAEDLLVSAASRPKEPASDILEAISAAARETPKKLVIWSDGLATAGVMNFAAFGSDVSPKELAKQLASDGDLPDLDKVPVVWVGLGETTTPMRQGTREGLERTWKAILKAAGAGKIVFDTHVGDDRQATEGLPDDPVPEVKVVQTTSKGKTSLSVPSEVLFRPDSAALADDADDVLQPIAEQIQSSDASRVLVVGHTADYGSTEYKRKLSTQRARAVESRLVRLGVPAAIVESRGVGSTDPAEPEWIDGRHDLPAARANRRVTIQIES